MTIRLRLTLVYSAILTLTLLIFGFTLYTIQYQDTLNLLKQDLLINSNKFVDALLTTGVVILPYNPDAQTPPPPRTFNQLSEDQTFQNVREREIVRVLDANGNLLASPFGLPEDALPLSDEALARIKQGGDIFETDEVSDEVMLIYSKPVKLDGKLAYIIQVARSLTERNRTLQSLATTLIIAGLTMVVVAFGVGWFLSGLTLRPIDRITKTAQDIGDERDFSKRVSHTGKQDEVGRLASTFNQMLIRLQEAYQKVERSLDQQREFVSDVSHELRTPLTTLRGNLGLLKHEPPLPKEEQGDILTDMVDESDRMIRLVNELLLLAHADAGRALAKDQINLNDIIQEVVRAAQQLEDQRNILVDLAPEPTITGDKDAFKQIMLILLDNALKYSETDVFIKTVVSGPIVEISIQDQGQGISREDMQHVFDRFYRAEDQLTTPGFGLGLPIAKSLVERMDGTIVLESDLGKGTTVVISFPIKSIGK